VRCVPDIGNDRINPVALGWFEKCLFYVSETLDFVELCADVVRCFEEFGGLFGCRG
jgi:hypothetical protein